MAHQPHSTEAAGYRAVVHRLATAQKPGRGAPPYSRWVNRRFGRWLAAAAYLGGLTPDAVTAISAVTTLSGLVLVALVAPVWWLGPLVAFLLLLGYALDSADGQLARLRGGGTKSGEWLDHVVDSAKIVVFHGVIAISFFRFGQPYGDGMLLIPLGFVLVSSVLFFAMILTDQLRRIGSLERGHTYAKPAGAGGALQTVVAIPTDYAVLCLTFVILGWREGFVWLYAALFAANALVLIAALVRWYRELKRA